MVTKFWNHCPNTPIELSSTANFVLEGKSPSGQPSYCLFYGADYSDNAKEILFGETVTIRELSDINLVWREHLVESELARLAELTFEQDSSVHIHSIVNLVFVLRAFQQSPLRSAGARRERSGRQIVLF